MVKVYHQRKCVIFIFVIIWLETDMIKPFGPLDPILDTWLSCSKLDSEMVLNIDLVFVSLNCQSKTDTVYPFLYISIPFK